MGGEVCLCHLTFTQLPLLFQRWHLSSVLPNPWKIITRESDSFSYPLKPCVQLESWLLNWRVNSALIRDPYHELQRTHSPLKRTRKWVTTFVPTFEGGGAIRVQLRFWLSPALGFTLVFWIEILPLRPALEWAHIFIYRGSQRICMCSIAILLQIYYYMGDLCWILQLLLREATLTVY